LDWSRKNHAGKVEGGTSKEGVGGDKGVPGAQKLLGGKDGVVDKEN